jgi:alpha-ketoglutarate-dependent taurine dioxygenase
MMCCKSSALRHRMQTSVMIRHLSPSAGGADSGFVINSHPLRLPHEPATTFGLELQVDLSAALAPATCTSIRESLHRHGLLLFRGQSLSPERQIEVTEACWGTAEPHPLRTRPGLLGDRVLVLQNGWREQNPRCSERLLAQ